MTLLKRRLILVAIAALGAVAPVSERASAATSSPGTTVSVDGTTVTITVHIDLFVGNADDTSVLPENAKVAQDLARDTERYWNEGFARYRYHGCLTLKLVIDMHVLPPSAAGHRPLGGLDYAVEGEPGYHAIQYANLDNRPVIYDATSTAAATGDYGSPFQHELFGTWSDDMQTSRDYAHEVGHLMGLGDDYTRSPEGDVQALDGREGTLMGGGDAIDQGLVDRVGDLAAKSGVKFPTCWGGTIHSTSSMTWQQSGGSMSCTEVWDLSLSFTTDKDGVATGSGTGAFVRLKGCHASFPWDFTNASTMAFNVQGQVTTSSVEIVLQETSIDGANQGLLNYTLTPVNPATLTIPITAPGLANGTITVHATADNGAHATGIHVVHLECNGCG